MYVDDDERPRFPGAEPGSADSIMESFQRVLDALDAARAELRDTGALGAPAPPPVTVEPLWERDAAPPAGARPAEPQRRRWAGACGAGAVGGLLVVSSLLANGALGTGDAGPAGPPVRPPHEDVHAPGDGDGRDGPEAPRRTYRLPRLHPGGASPGQHAIEVRAVAARFQDPPARPR
ncbi:hypothetical protein [Streptomyces lavendofoliae]|uniref:Uncharacterized protein n=1 Tax=Streptomyces lavendofoliae TaxID=67314 RepID=A0A918M515_9ACTN|nr:hypothetical protein [Streptomyces lavendofoliae]GGU47736.1 hypothetical protein GCM10010274_40290 [Streptomyces lavendofoliae]